jgi:hypothetical protein
MADNESTETPGLNDQALSALGQDEAKTAAAVSSLSGGGLKLRKDQYEAYDAAIARRGYGKAVFEFDRSKRIGTGPGERQGRDWRDEQARRMFALDQEMGKQDSAYSPTTESTDALYQSTEYLNHAIQQTQELDPEYAYNLALADRFLAMYPELAVATRNGVGFAGITEQLGAELIGMDLGEFSQKAESSYVQQTDIQDQFWSEFGNQLDPGTKDIMMISLAGLSGKEQKRVTALAAAYLDARPLTTMMEQMEFGMWLHQEASSVYARENDQSFWGKFGRVGAHVFTNPADFIQDEILGSVWTAASDGADAWYRKELKLEETMAISMPCRPRRRYHYRPNQPLVGYGCRHEVC